MEAKEQPKVSEYEQPKVIDYGTLLELTAVGGRLPNSDVPMGQPNSAFS